MGQTIGNRSTIRATPAAVFSGAHRQRRAIGLVGSGLSCRIGGALSQTYPELSRFQSTAATRALQWLTSKFCLTVLPYQSSKQMAINVMSEVFRKFSGLYAPLTVYELQTPNSELSYVLNNCGLRLQRSQPFSRSCSAFWERRVVSWTLTLDFLRLQTPNSELQYHMFFMIVVYTYSTTQTAIPPELLCILG